jgi:signal transduction histidine kinase
VTSTRGVRTLLALVLAVVTTHATAAPAPLLPDYRHTSWTANDGAPGQIVTMAQTTDGWLWLGTADGLYRFDGVAFERVALPERGVLGRGPIEALLASETGDLWIAYKWGSVSVRHADGRVDDIAVPAGTAVLTGAFDAMVEDVDGSLWALGESGLFHLAGGAWQKVLGRSAHEIAGVRSLLVDQDGVLWASFDAHVVKRERLGGAFVPAGPAGAQDSLMQSPDGRVWASDGAPDRMVQVSGAPARPRPARANQSQSRWSGQFDRDGNLWKLRCPTGACLLPASTHGSAQPGTILDPNGDGERLADHAHISSLDAAQVLEDREGNIWIATQAGIDRYQRNRVQSRGLPGAGMAISLAADADGSVWAADANDGALYRLGIDGMARQAGVYARVAGVDRAGALLLAGKRSIERRLHGVVTQIPLPPGPDGKPADLTVVGTLDDGRVLWMASFETGLMGLQNGVWRPRSAFKLPPKIVISAAGAPGQLWLADGDGGLTLYDGEHQPAKPLHYDAAMAGIATAVFAGPDVMVAGARGLAVLHRGAMHLLQASEPDALRSISGMAVTPNGDRWLNGVHGIVHVRAADWQRTMASPQEPLRFTVLDARDGYPGQAATASRLPSVVQGSGGELWFVATGGVARLATRTYQANLVAPTAQVSHVSTGQAVYASTSATGRALQLPPAPGTIRIAFTTPALRRPENVRFAWWMEGSDRGWVEGVNRRAVSYTGLAPGRYRFHVRAINEDGAAGGGEAVQAIDIAPTMVQTVWFRSVCALLLALLGVALYRYRIQVLTARLSAQMQARASERERIARTLHDTYLQSVHALLLRVGAVAQSLPGGSPVRAQLDSLLADASSAVTLGRGQVEQLRTGSPAAWKHALGDTVENVLARAAGPLRHCYPDVRYAMQVTGTRRALAPDVLDEAGQIGAEAMRNAFTHGAAANIDVQVEYGASFRVLVRDNGRGLDDEVRAAGYRSGHWGLLGMRERAGTIKAQLTLESAPGTGTSVLLTVPGPLAYGAARPGSAWFRRRIAQLANKLRG